MGIVINQSIKSSVVAYVGVAIGFVNVLWLYTTFLTAEQIGLFRLIQSSAFLLATFGQIGLGSSVVKFFPQFKEEKGFLGTALVGALIGFVLLLITTFLFKTGITTYFSSESALFVEYFGLTLAITLSLIFFQVLEAFCRSMLNIVLPTILRDLGLRVIISIAIFLYGFGLISFDLSLYLVLTAYAKNAIVLLLYISVKKNLGLSFNPGYLKGGKLKEVLHYGFYSLLGAGGTQIILQIDSVMVSGMEGLDANGIYTIAFFIGVVIEMPKRAITQVSSALISDSFSKKDMPAVQKLYQQTSINQMIIGSLLLLGIWSNIDNLYAFIPNGGIYSEGISVVLFIALGKLSDMIFGVNGEIIVMSKYYRFNVVAIGILAASTIVLNFYLIPIYGIEGAAIASFIAMLTFNLIKFIFVWVKFNLQPFSFKSLILLLIIAVTIIGESLLPKFDLLLLDLIIRSALITILLVLPTYYLKVSIEFNKVLESVFARIGLKRI